MFGAIEHPIRAVFAFQNVDHVASVAPSVTLGVCAGFYRIDTMFPFPGVSRVEPGIFWATIVPQAHAEIARRVVLD
jgi:hypothetical protein